MKTIIEKAIDEHREDLFDADKDSLMRTVIWIEDLTPEIKEVKESVHYDIDFENGTVRLYDAVGMIEKPISVFREIAKQIEVN